MNEQPNIYDKMLITIRHDQDVANGIIMAVEEELKRRPMDSERTALLLDILKPAYALAGWAQGKRIGVEAVRDTGFGDDEALVRGK